MTESIQAMQGRAAAEPIPKPIAQIEIARHPRTGEAAVWDAASQTIQVLDDQGEPMRTVYVQRIYPGDIDWTAVGGMAIGRRNLGDGDTCGSVALGHDPVRLTYYVEGLRRSIRDIPDGVDVDIFSRR